MGEQKRPSRAKMCNWLSGEIRNIRTQPSNPTDIQRWVQLGNDAAPRLRALSAIASELGWHADASLDEAWRLIQQYEGKAVSQ